MKKAVFEGRLYHDISPHRSPIKMILDTKGNPIKLFETLLSESGLVPKIVTIHAASRNKRKTDSADYILQGDSHTVTRESVLCNLGRVRVTVIVEEI